MRSATAALQTLINSGQQEFVKADLYTFYDSGLNILGRFSSVDADITIKPDGTAGGPTYLGAASGNTPLFKRGMLKTVVGIEVDTLNIEIFANATMLLNGVPWLQALRNGVLDGGRVRLDRFISDAWTNTTVGTVYWFGGRIGPITKLGRSSAMLAVLSDLNLLNVQMPRELYQNACSNTLYDAKCTLNRATFKSSNAVVAAFSSRSVIQSTLPNNTGYFDLGYVKFTSGVNNGVVRSIKNYVGSGYFNLITPLFTLCGNGDTFDIYPGCDKTQATCASKFSNVINFRGFPYIPIPETAL